MRKTLNQIRQELNDIADSHQQINYFYWGDWIEGYSKQDVDHVSMICSLQSAEIGKYTTNITLTIAISDLVRDGNENQYDVESDTLQIMKDIWVILNSNKWQSFAQVENVGGIRLLRYNDPDLTTGWFADFVIKIQDPRNDCILPISGYSLEDE